MPDGTIRADAAKIAEAVSVFRDAGEMSGSIAFDEVAEDLGEGLPGGSAIQQALDRACGAAAVCASRSAGRLGGLADFAHEAHRFLEASDEEFAALLGSVAGR